MRPEERQGRLERARRTLARRHGEKLLAEVTGGVELRARRDASALLAYTIAVAVHALTLVLAAAGIWWIVRGWGGISMALGLFPLALAWGLRPRLPRLPKDEPVLRRETAPELFALIDETALVAGTRGVDTIAVDAELNASVTTYGLRGRRLLTLGLPLWQILPPRQRIALLVHELGHYGNGDSRHGLVVATACRSLTAWRYYFALTPKPNIVQLVVNLACFVPGLLVTGVLRLLDRLTMRAAQRAEYLADRVAARAASTEAAVELMDRLLVVDSAATTLRREANQAALRGARRTGQAGDQDRGEGLWERLAVHMASIPEYEYERLRRVGALRGHSVDATHPPTHLRRTGLLTGPVHPAAVVTGEEREGRIAAELADARSRTARQILRDGFPDR
ncbi:M48 family metallopeptidase [Streptomyces sp. NBC_00289]|uniref:M48 family metallopeptidase n=1 Tax=Streptomyces sp. NBC_00289 TaxID=2975703 RepID=UPI0032495FBE